MRYLKSIELQTSYAHYFRTINCAGVKSLDYMVQVEVNPGWTRQTRKLTFSKKFFYSGCLQIRMGCRAAHSSMGSFVAHRPHQGTAASPPSEL
jgi:hypothetical protein